MPGFELTKENREQPHWRYVKVFHLHIPKYTCTHISNHTFLIFNPQGLNNNKNIGTFRNAFKNLCSEA